MILLFVGTSSPSATGNALMNTFGVFEVRAEGRIGTCSLTGKEGSDGLTVSFEDGTVRESFLSWRAFRQLLSMKAGQGRPTAPKPLAEPVKNGNL